MNIQTNLQNERFPHHAESSDTSAFASIRRGPQESQVSGRGAVVLCGSAPGNEKDEETLAKVEVLRNQRLYDRSDHSIQT